VVNRLVLDQDVQVLLKPRWRSALFLLALGLAGGFLAYDAVRVAWAETLTRSSNFADLQEARTLDPDNPEILRQLGLLYAFSSEEYNPQKGLEFLHRAVDLSPHTASYWRDLARICDSQKDTACTDQAYDHARALQPMMPGLEWIVANYYLQTERVDAALQAFQHLLALDPQYSWQVFHLCVGVTDDPLLVYEKVMPPSGDPFVKLKYVDFLSEEDRWDSAYQAWGRIAASIAPFKFSSIEPYLNHLLERGRIREAQTVWLDLQRLGVIPKPEVENQGNLINNGRFERLPLDAGFDWRFVRTTYLSLEFAAPSAYQGARCLHVDFTVARNEESEPVYQIVAVNPNQTYQLVAYARSEDITSDSGPRMRVVDVSCAGCPSAVSETTIGTTGWHPVSVKFTTGPQTQAVRVGVWRPISRAFPVEITGSFWLDDITMKPLNSSGGSLSLAKSPS